MKGLFLFIGESFRSGSQYSRIKGLPESYIEQINACQSHVNFIKKLEDKYKLEKSKVVIVSYSTQYNNELLKIYNDNIVSYLFFTKMIGLNNLFHEGIKKINNINDYDFIFYNRIDLYLKDTLFEKIDLLQNKILFANICWLRDCICKNKYPRVNDMIIFIPRNFYSKITYVHVYHDAWYHLIEKGKMNNDDIDFILNTFHDSDSEKDYNPLYYIVNRNQSLIWHDQNKTFDKNKFFLYIKSK